MKTAEKLYEGKAKIVYATEDPNSVLQYFKDDATAFNAQKKGSIKGKGEVNAEISAALFQLLEEVGVPTHFLSLEGPRELLTRKLEIFLIEVTVRNRVAGGMAKAFDIPEGTVLQTPVLEWHYKSDACGDPLMNDDHIQAMKLATPEEVEEVKRLTWIVNKTLIEFFAAAGLELVDYKLEFGKDKSGKIYLGDEISPDTCRLWDMKTGEKLDKDRFRRDLGKVEEAYQEVLKRVRER
ncbi:MAG: phosphoribosylaminoimidazolesuccinocarboxamide synthase [Candidatus Omnitrophica bacterium]|nr:phosphoribosylaminoimidazolesuccinocarboxamide synthase [Candidatus Omnitrophota bacterium]